LTINGVKLLKINWEEKEILIGFGTKKLRLYQKLSTLLSKNLSSFTKLSLVDLDLPNFPVLSKFASITDLTLWGVREVQESSPSRSIQTTPTINVKLGHFLQHFPNLTTLNCWYKTTEKKSKIKGLNLVSQTKLKKLALFNSNINLPPSYVPIIFENLTELYSDSCQWTKNIGKKFNEIFPNLKRVSFSNYDDTTILYEIDEDQSFSTDSDDEYFSAPQPKRVKNSIFPLVSVELVNNILKIASLQWILITCLQWPKEMYKFSSKPLRRPMEARNLKKFLEKAGILKDCGPNYSFALEKDGRKGVWKQYEDTEYARLR
jgi:hypothetical protein